MAYGRGQKRDNDSAGSGGSGSDSNAVAELGKNKRVSVRKFKSVNLVDIREFYEADGELRPGKKGISLTEDQWNLLVDNFDAINDALTVLGGGSNKKPKLSQPKSDEVVPEEDRKEDVKDESLKKEPKEEVSEEE